MRTQQALPSNRSFGFVFTAFFALVGAWSWWGGGSIYPWSFALALAMLATALVAPQVLTPFNRAWMKLGELLHPIANFIVLGAIFYLIFLPVGLAMRLAGRDALRRRFDRAAKSYWVPREPPGPDPSGLPNQF
jgi:hypothetical protein